MLTGVIGLNRRLFAVVVCSGIVVSTVAATISPALQIAMKWNRSNVLKARDVENQPEYYPLILRMEKEDSSLPEYVTELHRRGNLALVYVPASRIGEMVDLPQIERIEGRSCAVPVMDYAKRWCNYGKVEAAVDLPFVFDGTGVVVGFSDIGFDPNHIEFADPLTGLSRVRKLVNYTLDSDLPVCLEDAEAIQSWDTDDSDNYHATHVAGILAGGYMQNGYNGIAAGSEIVATTSNLYDAQLLAGCEEILSYADKRGLPAVINMSVSSAIGPHDGTSLASQYLEAIGKEAVVCISAGNDGGKVGYLRYSFPHSGGFNTMFKTFPNLATRKVSGMVDLWAADAEPVKLKLIIVDNQQNAIVYESETVDLDSGKTEWGIVTPDVAAEDGYEVDSLLGELVSCKAAVCAEINEDNGRYNAAISFDFSNKPLTDGSGELDSRYRVGIRVEGCAGQEVELYCSSEIVFNYNNDICADAVPQTDGTINDFVCGRNVIGVGALTSRDEWPTLGGEPVKKSETIGAVAKFSSYRSARDGVRLPHIVAPGLSVVSAISSPFVEEHPEVVDGLVASTIGGDGTKYYWSSECGTSMSSPFAAGVFALWLQADPTLSSYEMLEISGRTASTPDIEPLSPRWGGGILNAYDGLVCVLSSTGIREVRTDVVEKLEVVKISDYLMQVISFGGKPVDVRVFSLEGQVALTFLGVADRQEIDCSELQQGVYIVIATDRSGNRVSRKVVF